MTTPVFLRRDYNVLIMEKAEKLCHQKIGVVKFEKLPKELKNAIITVYYNLELYMSLHPNFPPDYDLKNIERVTGLSLRIPSYMQALESKSYDPRQYRNITRKILHNLKYAEYYWNLPFETRIKASLGLMKPIIKQINRYK